MKTRRWWLLGIYAVVILIAVRIAIPHYDGIGMNALVGCGCGAVIGLALGGLLLEWDRTLPQRRERT